MLHVVISDHRFVILSEAFNYIWVQVVAVVYSIRVHLVRDVDELLLSHMLVLSRTVVERLDADLIGHLIDSFGSSF